MGRRWKCDHMGCVCHAIDDDGLSVTRHRLLQRKRSERHRGSGGEGWRRRRTEEEETLRCTAERLEGGRKVREVVEATMEEDRRSTGPIHPPHHSAMPLVRPLTPHRCHERCIRADNELLSSSRPLSGRQQLRVPGVHHRRPLSLFTWQHLIPPVRLLFLSVLAMDTSAYTFYTTSANFSGDQLNSSSASTSSSSPSLVTQYQQQLAEHIESFTTTFLSSPPEPLSPRTRSSIVSLSSTPHPNASSQPPRRVRAYIDGCYDILHSGHYNAIRQAPPPSVMNSSSAFTAMRRSPTTKAPLS